MERAPMARQAQSFGMVELISIFGSSMLFAWLFDVVFGLFRFVPVASDTAMMMVLPLVFFAASSLCSILIGKTPQSFHRNLVKVGHIALAVILTAMFPVYAVLSLSGVMPTLAPLAIALAACAGFGFVFFASAYEDIAAHMRVLAFTRFSGVSALVGALLFIIFNYCVAPRFHGIFDVAFILLSGYLIWYVSRKVEWREIEDFDAMKKRFKLDRKITVLGFLFNAAFALAWSQLLIFGGGYLCAAFVLVCIELACLVYAFRDNRRMQDDYILVLMRACIAVTAVGFAILFFGNPVATFVGLIVVAALWLLVWIVVSGILLQHTVDFNLLVPYHLALHKSSSNLGFFVGFVIAFVLFQVTGADGMAMAGKYVPIIVAVVILLGMLLLPIRRSSDTYFKEGEGAATGDKQPYWLMMKQVGQDAGVMSADEELKRHCNNLANMYQLSPREGEILFYLAKGRNAKHIAEKMVVSEYTARTHIYHVYKKMDVHSAQEVIDLVEAHRR